MKKIWLIILWLCTIFLAWNFTQAKDYEYTNLDITANILEDGTINVNEDFTANFFIQKHWIIRDIPLNYSVWWKDFHIEISNINVPWKNFTTSNNNWNIEIKIWDTNKTIIWEQIYPISYSTYGLIKNFSWMWYAELYWNLVGYDFDTNINKVRAELILPKTYTWFTTEDFLITTDWKSKTIDWFDWTVDWSKWDKIIIIYDKKLSAKHGITLAIKFPNNYFEFNHEKQVGLIGHIKINNDLWLLEDWNIFFALVFLWIFIFLTLLFIIKHYIKKNEEKSIIIQYNPPKWLNSAEVWLLLDKKSWKLCILSLFYMWAAEWLINFEYKKDDYTSFVNFISGRLGKIANNSESKKLFIKKLKEIQKDKPSYEKFSFNTLFKYSNKIPIENLLKADFSSDINNLYDYWLEKWRFIEKKPIKDNKNYFLILWIVILCSIFLAFINLGWLWFFIVLLFMVYWHNSKTEETNKWAKLRSHILWYKKFLKSCDKNKLKLFLEEDPLYFDKILPYAVVFWLDTKLIRIITPIMKEMDINPVRYNWSIWDISDINSNISSISYSSDSWFDSWSSSSWWWSSFSSGWGWGGWGWRSW